MQKSSGSDKEGGPNRHMSRLGANADHAELLEIREMSRGQSCPQHCPYRDDARMSGDVPPLGESLDISEVAMLLGCSAWTVRQKYVPEGLPHLRASATGKFVFFRAQVLDWIFKRQAKGGQK